MVWASVGLPSWYNCFIYQHYIGRTPPPDKILSKTRKHSSRMCTARSLPWQRPPRYRPLLDRDAPGKRPGADPGFSVGGDADPPGRGRKPMILANFPKNCMKLRKFWTVGGGRPLLDPPLWTPRRNMARHRDRDRK